MSSNQMDSSSSYPANILAPLVSIIIRSMGRPTLRQALDSVSGQYYPRLELIVVNAKGAGHPPMPDHYNHIPLCFCSNDQPLRRSRAANRGMEQAQGDYLVFLDDDDWLLPRHISALVAALQRQPHLRVAYAGVECIREESDGHCHTVLVYNEPFDTLRLLYENYIPIHAVLFEKKLFIEGCRFDEALDTYEDWDFWLQLRAFGPFSYVDQVSAIYRLNTLEALGSTAEQGLQISAWDAIIHKWRDHWSDYELRKICAQAKSQQYARAECNVLAETLDQEKQATLAERQARQKIAAFLEQEQARRQEIAAFLEQEQARRQEIAAFLEQEQARHQETVSALQQRIEAMAEKLARQQYSLETATANLAAIQSSTIWRASYPYRWLMAHLRAWWQQIGLLISHSTSLSNVPCPPNRHPVDIIIPVYRGLAETRTCLDSVLATVPPDLGKIIVINDASPEPEIVAWLERLAEQNSRLTLLHNQANIGFVQTCNRGMALHPERDVVLLNSDTEVANDWLTRLQVCAYRDRRIGTATPFSNNATICSYPRFCTDNAMPKDWSTAKLDALFSHCNHGKLIDIPTAVGFCMYIRRDCLDETGYFDERHFSKGYGEENDFSMRAKTFGWRHVLCTDIFVYHAGSVSFADHQNYQKHQALKVLNQLYPNYDLLVHRYIAQDPARPFRLRVDLARLMRGRLPVVLLVTHDRGGGTKRHIAELAELFSDTLQFLLLHPGDNNQHLLSWLRSGEALQLTIDLSSNFDELHKFLEGLAVQRIHFHHTLGLHPLILELPVRLSVPYDFTIHDYYTCCPQISLTNYRNQYCNEPDETGCNRCLAILPTRDGVDIQTWRQHYYPLLVRAARVLAPSCDAASRFARYFPTANFLFAPHPDLDGHICPVPQPLPLSPDVPLRIAVLGALSPIKGADILEQCASDAYRRDLPLAFQLFGYAYRDLHCPPRDFLQIHGPYDDADLPALLTKAQPHLVWFPAQWPETYSYTLSTCLRLGLPVVVPNLGAFPERVADRPWSWVRPWQQSYRAWNDFFIQIKEENFALACSPSPYKQLGCDFPLFDYVRDYWIASAPTTPTLDEAQVDTVIAMATATFAYPRMTATTQWLSIVKSGLWNILVRLRQTPMLYQTVRRIPLGWQTRIKRWLRDPLS